MDFSSNVTKTKSPHTITGREAFCPKPKTLWQVLGAIPAMTEQVPKLTSRTSSGKRSLGLYGFRIWVFRVSGFGSFGFQGLAAEFSRRNGGNIYDWYPINAAESLLEYWGGGGYVS